MKAGVLIAICGASSLMAGDEPRDSSRYDVIARRNAFGLQAAPAVPAVAPPGASEAWKPPPDLKLTGMVCFPRVKAASLYLMEHGKPPASYVLAEGEARDGIELVEINPSAETVRVKNHGVFVVLSFQTHGLKPNENAAR